MAESLIEFRIVCQSGSIHGGRSITWARERPKEVLEAAKLRAQALDVLDCGPHAVLRVEGAEVGRVDPWSTRRTPEGSRPAP